jgi:hypothetical protein
MSNIFFERCCVLESLSLAVVVIKFIKDLKENEFEIAHLLFIYPILLK